MNPIEKKYIEFTARYFSWLNDIKKSEEELKKFEKESGEFQKKLDVIFKEYAEFSIKPSDYSVQRMYVNANMINFISDATKFSNNMTAYYNIKSEYEDNNIEYCNKLGEAQKDFGIKNLKLIINDCDSLEKLYVPKINDLMKYLKNNLSELQQEYSKLKKEINKFLQ
jgi:hypothetical protein